MNVSELVGRAVDALASSDADDSEVAEALAAGGMNPAHARAAVVFTTLAFGRVALQFAGPQFDRHYQVGEIKHLLAEHPMFIEALAAARGCDKDRFRDVALRSSEINAINAAAHQGSALADLTLSPAVIGASWVGGHELESRAVAELVLESEIAQAKVIEAFAAHGAGELDVQARLYSGVVRPGAISVQLDVVVKHPSLGERAILESSGGIGKGIDAAINDVLGRFFAGSLHPIIAALVDESAAADQIEIEELVGWRAIMGPVLHQMKVPASLAYGDLLDVLLERFCQSDPDNVPHWIRIYVMQGPEGPYGLDVLVDNEPWEVGEQIVSEWPWPREGSTYGIRHFVFLHPA